MRWRVNGQPGPTGPPDPPMRQTLLFDVETIRSPLCVRVVHCGGRAIVGSEVVKAGAVNRLVRCLDCGAVGEVSVNTEER